MIISKGITTVLAFMTLVSCACHSPALAQGAMLGTATIEVAQGGPFVASGRRTQRFVSTFELSEREVVKPFTLHIHNGFGGSPGFNWIRAFLGADMDLSGVGRAEEPNADLLYDESYVQRHTISLDLTGKVFTGINTLIIEGTAQKGAVMSWILEGPLSPEFATINPTATQPGSRLTLAGRGFSLDPGENRISIGGHSAELLNSTRTTITVKVPEHIKPGPASVVVTTNNVQSAPYSISITAPSALPE
ncbi:MAG: IPT/TIG domain-containing protein [Candidatus Obscuribacterales bacterium]|nr:IPT/TIG domain-containing protein [Candidatus Obscuribacterales bacterium]